MLAAIGVRHELPTRFVIPAGGAPAGAQGRAARPVALARAGVQGKNAHAAWSGVITSTSFERGFSR
jgi:hypothetical protein